MPLGMYSNGVLNLNSTIGWGNSTWPQGYLSRPVETPYSPAAIALQGGSYPLSTMSAPNDMTFTGLPYYNATQYPYGMGYGVYGQRGIVPGVI